MRIQRINTNQFQKDICIERNKCSIRFLMNITNCWVECVETNGKKFSSVEKPNDRQQTNTFNFVAAENKEVAGTYGGFFLAARGPDPTIDFYALLE